MKILHLFGWKLNDINEEIVRKAKEQGFTHIQISPIQKTKSNGNEWWLLYQPCSLTIGNYQIGTKKDLINLCNRSHKVGLKIIQDIILRHVGTNPYCSDKPHDCVDSELLPFIVNRPLLRNDNNRREVTDYNCGMPMLDYENPNYQKICIRFLDELVECGVDMFRLDQLKHYRLPEENGTFLVNVMKRYNCYGEAIFCDDNLLNKMSEIMMVGTNVGHTSDTRKTIAWYESHDTYLNTDNMGYTRRFTSDMCVNEYSVICNYFPNTLFYVRPWDNTWKSERIKEINFRYENNN